MNLFFKIKILTLLGVLWATALFAKDIAFEKAFDVFKNGYTAGDQATVRKAIKMLETAAKHGSGESAFNLAVLYRAPQLGFNDDKKACYWSLKAAKMNFVDAYYAAADCEMKENLGEGKIQAFEKYAIPWIRKIASEDKPDERAKAQETIDEWERAKVEESRGSSYVTLGSLFSSFGIDSYSSSEKVSKNKTENIRKKYICVIYCDSASGPRISREFFGASREDVAKYVGDNADDICRNSNVSRKASDIDFSPSQCREK